MLFEAIEMIGGSLEDRKGYDREILREGPQVGAMSVKRDWTQVDSVSERVEQCML